MIQQLKKDERRAVINGLLVVIALHICWSLSSMLLRGLPIPEKMLITRISFWIYFGIVYWYASKIEKQPVLLWKEERHSFGFYIISVIVILVIIVAAAFALWVPLKQMGFKASTLSVQFSLMSVPLKVFTLITAGVLEEIIFRGYIQSRLQLIFTNRHFPVFISATCFALVHTGYGTLINMLVPFVIGLVFGYHYHKYRNIKILIICHLLIDINALFHPVPKH
jgi:membrane protease YdiL (CAAX protease family)